MLPCSNKIKFIHLITSIVQCMTNLLLVNGPCYVPMNSLWTSSSIPWKYIMYIYTQNFYRLMNNLSCSKLEFCWISISKYIPFYTNDLLCTLKHRGYTDHNFSSAQGNAHQNSIHSNMFHLMGSMLTRDLLNMSLVKQGSSYHRRFWIKL
jgi:hypothetical protein